MRTKTYILCAFFALLGNVTFSQESSQNRKYDFPRRNSIYLQNLVVYPTLYYDRVIPISDHFGIIPKVGYIFGLGYTNALFLEPSIFFGGNKNYGEIGVVFWPQEFNLISLNYRYMGKKGLLLKVGGLVDYSFMFPFVGIGYSF
jgi:hypothetical protein